MGTTNINFKNNNIECYSLGRNGYIKTKGISYTHNGDIVTIEPIRANGQIGRCSIQIPFEDLIDLVKTIAPYADQAVEEYEESEESEELKEQDVAIGDTIEIKGKTYKCVKNCETEVCENCALFSMINGCDYVWCGELERADETDVHFELVDTEKDEDDEDDDENTAKESTQIKVGEVGFLGGKKVRCRLTSDIFGIPCRYCAFYDRETCMHEIPCCCYDRDDRLEVYYEEVKE